MGAKDLDGGPKWSMIGMQDGEERGKKEFIRLVGYVGGKDYPPKSRKTKSVCTNTKEARRPLFVHNRGQIPREGEKAYTHTHDNTRCPVRPYLER